MLDSQIWLAIVDLDYVLAVAAHDHVVAADGELGGHVDWDSEGNAVDYTEDTGADLTGDPHDQCSNNDQLGAQHDLADSFLEKAGVGLGQHEDEGVDYKDGTDGQLGGAGG